GDKLTVKGSYWQTDAENFIDLNVVTSGCAFAPPFIFDQPTCVSQFVNTPNAELDGVEIEAKYKDKGLTEIPDEESGDFGSDFPQYRWTLKSREMEFPDLTPIIMGQSEEPNEMLISMIKQMTEYLNKAIKEVRVSVFVRRGKREMEFSATQYFVDYTKEFTGGGGGEGGPNRRQNRTMKNRGFTLLEVIIAMMIMAFLSLFTVEAIQKALKTKTKVQKEIDKNSTLRDALRIMERDINMAFNYRDINLELHNQTQAMRKKKSAEAFKPDPKKTQAENQAAQLAHQQAQAGAEEKYKQKVEKIATQFIGEPEAIDFTSLSNTRLTEDSKISSQAEIGYKNQILQAPLHPRAVLEVPMAPGLQLYPRRHHKDRRRNRAS
ncbi:MAG: prepilin-type N-terminal cleavage/methylation domain-containing protein, partial [Bdellovibrionaceae bacterium]|nr:prepilin-type N-terminal cleavage/methylation domain-containing protein [Pseudobdellovibrionaceae bacterium]